MEVITKLWTLNCWLCSFSFYWFLPYCSDSSKQILKDLILESPKRHDESKVLLFFHAFCHTCIENLMKRPNMMMSSYTLRSAKLASPLNFLVSSAKVSSWLHKVKMLRKSAILLVGLPWSIFWVTLAQLTILCPFKFWLV